MANHRIQLKAADSSLFLQKQMENKYNDYEYPKISIVLPVYNCAQSITLTLDSLLAQDYPDYEVIIVDAGSTDRTVEMIKGYHNENIHMYSMSGYQRYAMLNKGISQASGVYINFLFPGDFYIFKETLKHMMNLAMDHEKPELVFCGTLIRDGRSDVKLLYRHLSIKVLKRGQQPTSLQSIWFRSDVFRELGKFNTNYKMRGAFEFLCRFSVHKNLRAASTTRVLTDYDLRIVSRSMVFRHFWETLKVLFKFFGPMTTLKWFFLYQKDVKRLLKLWYRTVRRAFVGD